MIHHWFSPKCPRVASAPLPQQPRPPADAMVPGLSGGCGGVSLPRELQEGGPRLGQTDISRVEKQASLFSETLIIKEVEKNNVSK